MYFKPHSSRQCILNHTFLLKNLRRTVIVTIQLGVKDDTKLLFLVLARQHASTLQANQKCEKKLQSFARLSYGIAKYKL